MTPEAAADTEIQVALAVLKYARFARGGRINPANISQLMDQQPTLVPPKTVLTDIAAAEKPDAYLTSLHPKHPQFEALRQMLIKLRGGEVKEEVAPPEDPALSVQLPMGRVIRPGRHRSAGVAVASAAESAGRRPDDGERLRRPAADGSEGSSRHPRG